jgi:hypothetical protein
VSRCIRASCSPPHQTRQHLRDKAGILNALHAVKAWKALLITYVADGANHFTIMEQRRLWTVC